MQSKQKGDVAVAMAISYFVTNGYEVCLPIGDKRSYDLVIEKDSLLSRVQVKYAGIWNGTEKCYASFRVMGGNQSCYTVKKYVADDFDLLFVYSARNETYIFPWKELNPPRSSISVESPQYRTYKVLMQG